MKNSRSSGLIRFGSRRPGIGPFLNDNTGRRSKRQAGMVIASIVALPDQVNASVWLCAAGGTGTAFFWATNAAPGSRKLAVW
jgi:hypothetical protein